MYRTLPSAFFTSLSNSSFSFSASSFLRNWNQNQEKHTNKNDKRKWNTETLTEVSLVMRASQKLCLARAQLPQHFEENCEETVWLGPGWRPTSFPTPHLCTRSWSIRTSVPDLFGELLVQMKSTFAGATVRSLLGMCWHHLPPLLLHMAFLDILGHWKGSSWLDLEKGANLLNLCLWRIDNSIINKANLQG